MSQRRLVLHALRDAGLLESGDPRVQEFVRLVREHRELCWRDLVSEFREKYDDIADRLLPALERSGDPLIRNMLIQYADPERPKERQMLAKIARDTDLDEDRLAAAHLRDVRVPEVQEVLRRHKPRKSDDPRRRRGTEEPS